MLLQPSPAGRYNKPVSHAIPYRNPLVRDLAWSISSPAVLQRRDCGMRWMDDPWFSTINDRYQDDLKQLDSNPGALRESIDSQKDRRLGNYFETLWRFWLDTNDRYRLLHANLPVRNRERTIGEFDLLVEDRDTGKTLHWELAVKFYLGVADTGLPANWWGPAQRDRLDIKTRRLLEHQGRLSLQPESRDLLETLSVQIDETWLIFKGRLFYPLKQDNEAPCGANPAHLRGFWVSRQSMHSLRESLWLPLERHQWLAPLTGIDPAICLDNSGLVDKWEKRAPTHPVCIASIEKGNEIERGFIVPDSWAEKIPRA